MRKKILALRAIPNKILFDFFFGFTIFIVTPISVWANAFPKNPETNFVVLGVCTFFCIIFMLIKGWIIIKEHSNAQLKFKINKDGLDLKDNRDLTTILIYLNLTLAGIAFLLIAKEVFNLKVHTEVLKNPLFIVFTFVLCWAQVICYRTFFFKEYEEYTKSKSETRSQINMILLNNTCFTTMHCMFSWQFIVICLIGGLGFAFIYYHYRNSLWMTVSHTVLNITAASLGAFSA